MLENWTPADIAGVVGGVVSVCGAFLAQRDRAKAEASAKRAEELSHKAVSASQQAAAAQKESARANMLKLCAETARIYVEFDGASTVTITNPMPFEIRNLKVESWKVKNRQVDLDSLAPMENKLLEIDLDEWDRAPGKRQVFYFSWLVPASSRNEKPTKVNHRWELIYGSDE